VTFAAKATAFAKTSNSTEQRRLAKPQLSSSSQAASFFAFFAFMYRSLANNVAGHKGVLLRVVGVCDTGDSLTVVCGALPPRAVKHGEPRHLAGEAMQGRSLFLCYPPPASDMAVDCLRFFSGRTVAVVGEWDGDTATAEFTTALIRAFRLKRRVPLPKYARACRPRC
jgi:hypothetical protein